MAYGFELLRQRFCWYRAEMAYVLISGKVRSARISSDGPRHFTIDLVGDAAAGVLPRQRFVSTVPATDHRSPVLLLRRDRQLMSTLLAARGRIELIEVGIGQIGQMSSIAARRVAIVRA